MPFGEVAARVIRDRRTYLNVDRLYTLWQAVESLPAAARAVAEVGVYRGGSAWFVAEALRLGGKGRAVLRVRHIQGPRRS